MTFLLDTNVVSEWVKPRPNSGVIAWLENADEDRLFVSVVTLAELRHGVERMPIGRRRRLLEDWIQNELPVRFEGRVLPVDIAVANAWGLIVARHEAAGRPIHAMDAFLAATARAHALTLITRNASDFSSSGVRIISPWEDA